MEIVSLSLFSFPLDISGDRGVKMNQIGKCDFLRVRVSRWFKNTEKRMNAWLYDNHKCVHLLVERMICWMERNKCDEDVEEVFRLKFLLVWATVQFKELCHAMITFFLFHINENLLPWKKSASKYTFGSRAIVSIGYEQLCNWMLLWMGLSYYVFSTAILLYTYIYERKLNEFCSSIYSGSHSFG